MIDLLPLILTCASSIHVETMYPLIKTESAFNPYAIAIVRDTPLSKQPRTKEEAEQVIDELEAKGANFSVGLGQINKVNFKRFNLTAKQLLDPCTNLQISEKILNECYERSPGAKIGQALSCYYSGNFRTGYTNDIAGLPTYVERVINNYKPESEISSIKIPSIKNEISDIKKTVSNRKNQQVNVVRVKKAPEQNKRLIKSLANSSNSSSSSKSIFYKGTK